MKKDENIKSKPPELGVLNGWRDFANEAARKQQWEYFVIDQFLRGNHNIRGNPNDNSLVITKTSETINYPINKVFSTFRAVRGFVTRHKPVIVVDPTKSTPEAVAYARQANAILERDNKLNNYRKINKEWVYFGVKYGVGYRQIGYDPTRKCCVRWSVDPNDLLVGSRHGEMEDAPYIIKTVVRTLGYWKSKYPKDHEGNSTDDLGPDNELSDNEYKSLSLQLLYPQSGLAPANRLDEQTKIGYECWYQIFEPNSLGGTINKVCFTKDRILSFEETPFNDYPFVSYKSDIVPDEVSGEGHIKHIIAPQRMLNLLNTQMLEYNHIVNRGRFLKDKNAGFKVINTKEGQIIEKNPGKNVTYLNPPSINPLLKDQLSLAIEFIEDIGGQHQASMGATPARVSSGDAIEALQLGDSNNIVDLRDNFEDSLAQEAAWILKMYSLYEKDGFVINNKLPNGNPEIFAVMGQAAYDKTGGNIPDRYYVEDNGDYCSVCAILPDNHVKVSITSQLGETRSARLEMLFRLVELGLPLKFVLEYLEFPNTSDIFERIASESLAEIKMQAMQAAMAPQPGQVGGMGAEMPEDQLMSELEAMPGARGGMAPPPAPGEMVPQLEELNQELGGLANG